ncbi:hypothetical protein EHQ53_16605 [Leptospira langatensis]|uniref:Uncharacterized protein n=1 Tax=Leptospira langatensis TaxID=2484983 RepID=A0A5F1ZNI3_9LEPT|nr:hypothetical protein [Leptospira langatensis]TGK05263.1 hypothetical protein EHO57_00845 [Leptospira langatensis]TGL38399.1 hypothetical protein EHQ53_16605 [Leptospira langatensis]
MNFFTKETSWSNAEFIVFKLCVASIYVLIGAYFSSFFLQYRIVITVVFAITVVWTVSLWLKKMRSTK